MDIFIKEIFDLLIAFLPSDWGKVVLHITLRNNNQSVSLFVKDKYSSKYFSFVDLQKIGVFSKYEFQNVSIKIGEASRDYQKSFEKQWTGYTLVIFREGKNYIDFEYEYSLNALPIGWDKKYLD